MRPWSHPLWRTGYCTGPSDLVFGTERQINRDGANGPIVFVCDERGSDLRRGVRVVIPRIACGISCKAYCRRYDTVTIYVQAVPFVVRFVRETRLPIDKECRDIVTVAAVELEFVLWEDLEIVHLDSVVLPARQAVFVLLIEADEFHVSNATKSTGYRAPSCYCFREQPLQKMEDLYDEFKNLLKPRLIGFTKENLVKVWRSVKWL